MARLPKPGGDINSWGDILNDYLLEQHNSDGTHNVAAILQPPPQPGRVLASNSAVAGGVDWKSLAKSDVGLSNVDNTSDAAKPISAAQQIALDTKATQDDAIAFAIAL
jgi:hypothetical protein